MRATFSPLRGLTIRGSSAPDRRDPAASRGQDGTSTGQDGTSTGQDGNGAAAITC